MFKCNDISISPCANFSSQIFGQGLIFKKRMSETDSGSSDGGHAPPVIEAAATDSNQHGEESQDGDANSGSRHVNPVREAPAEDGNNDPKLATTINVQSRWSR